MSGKKFIALLGFLSLIFCFYIFYANKQLELSKYALKQRLGPNNRLYSTKVQLGRTLENETSNSFVNRKVQTKYILDCFDEADVENVSLFDAKNIHNSFDKNVLHSRKAVLCSTNPPNLKGIETKNSSNMNYSTWQTISTSNPKLKMGGTYSPTDCEARYRVAIVIPLRDRESQLRTFLAHMHPIWQRQQLDYTVYTITQSGNITFNRAKLMNVGFAEARKEQKYDCYVFHDVDMLLENDQCLYWCLESNPRHLTVYVDKFKYKPVSYGILCGDGVIQYFGGASMMTENQILRSNGFSNLYWGWGGEDDEMFVRLKNKGYEVQNPYGKNCSYSMIKHKHESSNSPNRGRNQLMTNISARQDDEGLSTLRYKMISIERLPAYTNVTVDIGGPSEKMTHYMEKDGPCSRAMPWDL